jgi:S-adenosylmethionine hydrolase
LLIGCHICVVDPGVGTDRRAIAIETQRGDILIGPDNGVLLPAAGFLGGIVRTHALTDERFMRLPVSPIFHGRDIFAPAAAHLSSGVPITAFGLSLDPASLYSAPYHEAAVDRGAIHATVIHANHYGNVFLNVRNQELHKLAAVGSTIRLSAGNRGMDLPYRRTFGEVSTGQPVIMDDDFGRVEIAVNQGSFLEVLKLKAGDVVELRKA